MITSFINIVHVSYGSINLYKHRYINLPFALPLIMMKKKKIMNKDFMLYISSFGEVSDYGRYSEEDIRETSTATGQFV